MQITLIRLNGIKDSLGLSRSSIYAGVADGTISKPVTIAARAVAWPSDEIAALVKARIAGKSTGEIKALVRALHEARKGQA